ncbi:MAG: ComEA family DNA-binding protein, partial [Dehalococcoidia bacterium]|nr:ComEA family DNA-binding protein [Dehalococcoidia bacterium]
FMAAVIIVLCGTAGCGQGNEIEIYIPQTTTQSQIGQIYVGGGVNNPGYYPLKEGDGIDDLIRAAGGLTQDANIDNIELLIAQSSETENGEQRININTAPAWLLEALPGIGEVKAQAIIDYRQQNGLFKNINELLKVDGIGQGTLDN